MKTYVDRKSKAIVSEKVTELPNPDAKRLPVVQECLDINCCKMIDGVCATYLNPSAIQHRMGKMDACAINTKFTPAEIQGKARAGQQKQKKKH